MLRALLKRDDEQLSEELPEPCPEPRSKRRPRTRARPFRLINLYPGPLGAYEQAAELLCEVQTYAVDGPDQYVTAQHLMRFYKDTAQRRKWQVLSWHAVGREFGRIARRRTKKVGLKKCRCYRIPRMTQTSP